MVPAPNQSLLPSPLPLSVSLIECGAVHTAFHEKLEGGPGGALERADAQTRHLFAHYQRGYEQALSEAQDPEEVTEVGANGVSGRSLWVGRGDTTPGVPGRHMLLFPLQLFLTAMRAPQPALRYFSTNRFLPLARMRTEDPSGSSYVEAMHREAFSDLQVQEGAKAGAQVSGDPDTPPRALICLPECAIPRVTAELGWSASDKPGQNKSCHHQADIIHPPLVPYA